jgi:ubiquinone/menaquinone biosynthesis C-methylase UbiE
MLSRCTLLYLGLAARMDAQKNMFADADAYERYIGRWSRELAPLLVEFSRLADGTRVLDVGCGTGALAAAVLAAHPRCRVVGIDPSPEYVAYAKTHCSQNCEFEIGDAQKLRFPDAGFDASVSLLVFNFIPDPAKALDELRRVTRPGGPITAAVWDYSDGMRMLRVFFDAAVELNPAAEAIDEKHMPLSKQGDLGQLWRSEGLKDVAEKSLEFEMVFRSFDDYWAPFLGGTGPGGRYVASLDPAGRNKLENRLRERLQPPIRLPARAWAVRGAVA